MDLDTVKLRGPALAESEACAIVARAATLSRVDNATGELLFELTTGELAGEYDHRVRFQVRRERWESVKLPSGNVSASLRPCEPFLELEGSLHKAMLGHNVYGGPGEPYAASRWLLSELSRQLGADLGNPEAYQVRRADWVESYGLAPEACASYLRTLAGATYPRRKVARYAAESVFVPGRTVTLKLYHKGPEFDRHDRARLRDLLGDDELHALRERAYATLRVEASVKARKLDELHGRPPLIGELTAEYLGGLHDVELSRLLREGEPTMRTVRTHEEVKARLHDRYPRNRANALFGTWLKLATLGEASAKDTVARRTLYRHVKELREACVSWRGADVGIVEGIRLVPADFAPVRTDPRRITGEDPRVVELLAPYRRAA